MKSFRKRNFKQAGASQIYSAEVQHQPNLDSIALCSRSFATGERTNNDIGRHGLQICASKGGERNGLQICASKGGERNGLQICASKGPSIFVILTVIGLIFQSCDRDKNNPGYDYFPDMAYSKAYETYAPNPNFPDGKTLQAPVDGTISREGEHYPYKKTDADMLKAAKMKNPLLPDANNIARGKVVYQNICLQCHGASADGKGHLFVSGKYPYPPADLMSQKIVNKTDGEMFHAITVGFGIMPAHGIIVRPEDRWKTILYIRGLQKK